MAHDPKRMLGLLILLSACLVARAQDTWRFVDATATAGASVDHGFVFGFFGEPDMMSGGAAAGDLDNDGDHDLVVSAGDLRAPRVLRNAGAGVFVDASSNSGLPAMGAINGVVLVDLDDDGDLDLVFGGVSGQGVRAFANDGTARFVDTTATLGLTDAADTYSAAAGDADGDGDLDLAFGHWARGEGRTGHLWRRIGNGYERADALLDATADWATLSYTFTPTFGDLDNDGRQDMVWAADFGTSRVALQRNGRLVDATDAAISDENGMGSALADYDNDGDLDWFVSSIWDADGVPEGNWGTTGNRLYRNRGDGRFDDVTSAAGVREGDWGWASCFADFDNDGDLDLAHVNGMSANPAAQYHADRTRMFINNGAGTFVERGVSLGLNDTGQGRALVCFDADGDGDIDLFVQNNSQGSRLWRNDGGNASHWLTLRLRQPAPNVYAIGARITLRAGNQTQTREIQAGNNYLSANPSEAHFGLGEHATSVELTVRWPNGQIDVRDVAQIDRTLILTRGAGMAGVASSVTGLRHGSIVLLILACLALGARILARVHR
jgi:hypothetical protein